MGMPPQTSTLPSDPASLVERPTLRDTGTMAAAIRARPNEPFILIHAVGDWEVCHIDGVPTWTPVLSQIPIKPGLYGCRTLDRLEQPEQAIRDVMTYWQNQGRIVISPNTHVPADLAGKLGEGSYMRKMACRANPNEATGTRYIQVWDVPVATPPGEDQVFIFDGATNAKWRAHLVATGVIPEPSELVTARKKQIAAQRPQRVASSPYPDKDLKEERKQAAQTFANDHANAQIPGHAKPPAPAPKGKDKAAA